MATVIDRNHPLETIRYARTGLLYPKPCLVWWVHLMGAADVLNNVKLYDDVGENWPTKLELISQSEGEIDLILPRPILFFKAIYCVIDCLVSEVVIGFDPWLEG